MNSGDIWSGSALGALGAYVVVQSSQWEYLGPDGPGPGFFPVWYGIALVALSLLLVVNALRRRELEPARAADRRRQVARALGAWAAFAAASALLPVLGFLLCFACLAAFIACAMYGRPLPSGIAAGVIGAAAFYLIFPLALGVSLPAGLLGF